MKRAALLLLLTAGAMSAQFMAADLIGLAAQVRSAVDEGDWKRAATLSSQLKEAVRKARNAAWAQESAGLVDRTLSWLPEDTETVVVAQEPFALAVPTGPPGNALIAAQRYVVGPSAAMGTALEGRTARFAILVARKFAGRPAGSGNRPAAGMIDYQGCGIYQFGAALPEGLMARPPDDTVHGQPIWKFRTVLMARPKPDVLLICNDSAFFNDVLAHATDQRLFARFAGPLSPSWKFVNRKAPLWAWRRFVPDRAGVDPTQPINPGVLGKPDPFAIGLTVQIGSSGQAQAKWISEAEGDPWQTTLSAGAFEHKAHSRQLEKNVWELTIDNDDQVSAPAVFALMSCLGFAVAL